MKKEITLIYAIINQEDFDAYDSFVHSNGCNQTN